MSERCKLCASFAASELPTASERDLRGSDSFTRHPQICDACLDWDYAARRRWGTLEQWAGLSLGLLLALLATPAVLLMYRRELHDLLSPIPRFLHVPTTLLVIAVPSIVLCVLLVHLLFWVMTRRSETPADDASAAIDAERFRWLAAWGETTGNRRFARRMARKAAALRVKHVQRTGDVA